MSTRMQSELVRFGVAMERPLLEHFDATGVTRRRGDVRVAGPQLAKRAGPELAEPDARRGESKADGLRETRGRPHGQQEQRVP